MAYSPRGQGAATWNEVPRAGCRVWRQTGRQSGDQTLAGGVKKAPVFHGRGAQPPAQHVFLPLGHPCAPCCLRPVSFACQRPRTSAQ